jgi:CRISPR-associated protein Cas1
MQDLHLLPKLRDSLTYLYVEHAVLERKDSALLVLQETGRTAVPVANLCLLMLGPGTNLTHAAVKLLAENGCSVLWTGEDMQKFYAQGLGETRRAYHLLRQAELASDPQKRLRVVLKMYEKRFGRSLEPELSLEQIRGMEGVRVRNAYAHASRKYGVAWHGRNYDRGNWNNSDPVNRALSAANALLNGLCHAAIVSGGYSPGLGFLHTGKQLSFVYDIADLYKARLTIPIAFQTMAEGTEHVEARARQTCREVFRQEKLLDQVLPDIDGLLEIQPEEEFVADEDPALPEPWWGPDANEEEAPAWSS